MKKLIVAISILFSATLWAQQPANESVFSKKQKFDQEGIEIYSSNTDMKSYKKFGLGLAVGGASGLFGLNAEVNLDQNEALIVGLGTGPSYGTFNVGWKHNFEAMYLSPYSKVSYSKWFSTSGNSAADSDVLKRIFSENDLRAGRFDADFLIGGFGIEYNQLEGELAGINFFGEVMMMAEITKTTFIPNGSIGIVYYY